MAKLHRRIPRFPHRQLILVLALSAVAAPAAAQEEGEGEPPAPEVAEADDPTLTRIEALVRQLGGPDADERRAAHDALVTLNEEALPAIRARLARLRRDRPPRNWAVDIMNRFRRRSNDDDEPDEISLGALAELDEEHADHEREKVLSMAEPLLLWRALDAMGTLEAQRAVFPIMGFDRGLYLPEARNWVRRRGAALTAAAIEGRTHDDRFVRRWGSWAMRHLGADDPGRVVQELDEAQLPDVIRAYARLRMQSAMRVIVSYVDSDRRRIRRAARWAMSEYGGNAIWILRTAYHDEVGEHAPRAWGWRRLSEELYQHADAERLAAVRAALDEGTAALEAGDFATMRARYDDVLARAPELEEPTPVAEGYAALAAHHLGRGETDEAIWAYRRALRLAPDGPRAAGWRARLEYAVARTHLADGVLDEEAFERVLARDPDHPGAIEALAAAAPAAGRAPPGTDRTRWGLAAAALLALLGVGLLWRGRDEPEDVDEPTCDTTLDAGDDPTLEGFDAADATLADSTLPG